MRRTVVRIALVIVMILIAYGLYTSGKGHVFLLDNNAITIGGKEWQPLDAVTVSVDRSDPIELYKRNRDKIDVKGKRHTIVVTTMDRLGNPIETYKKRFRIRNSHNMYLLSIPALVGDADLWIEEFIPLTERREAAKS